ncbi:hypothetical protein J8I87_33885 [Paraburkholderia sp. LEh10]|uniref:hypothetical protein n=1 Tax=Paraburkholderia sp. LEh10 TaxID=2821353 RepID=UPI001AE7EDF4|nr:hypothetical protein [Paraburkholderia sp. LEh10]MBP0594566.1 hypothetical protein [Paraburkholderia sp. LEh10]
MKTIIGDMSVLKPWFDDPATEEDATMCMHYASVAVYLRMSKNPQLVAKAAMLLREVSKTSKIPHSVIERYSRGVQALHALALDARGGAATHDK